MKIIDNINSLLGDDLKETIKKGDKLKIAASCFSIYAYEALKDEFEKIESLEFIFTEASFIPSKVTDKIKKEQKQFHIPNKEKYLYGNEFEIQLKNKLTQKAIAKECANRGGQVFISTYSPDLLNAIKLNEVFWLEKKDGYTQIKRAKDNEQVNIYERR